MTTTTPRTTRKLRLTLASALLAGTASALLPPDELNRADAGCLAPADTAIDASRTFGPFWGNDAGTVLYAAAPGGSSPSLLLAEPGQGSEEIAVFNEPNDHFVGSEIERWVSYHAGTVNGRGDVAFVASTTVDDDPGTPEIESIVRRGVYARRGNTLRRLGRFGLASPILDEFGAAVPWGSFFDAVALGRPSTEPLRVVFSGQVGQPDGRNGLFTWAEGDTQPAPLVLTGDASPSGGTFASIGRIRANEAGDLCFLGQTQLQPGDPLLAGLFLFDRNGSRTRLVRFGAEGDAVPGGGTFGFLADLDVDGSGAAIFCATISGGGSGSALFRAAPPLYEPEVLFRQGDATPLGGTYGSFASAIVRADEDGSLGLFVPMSDDVGGTGLFTLPAGAAEPIPLITVKELISGASLGAGRMAYQDDRTTHTVLPSDGTEEGPTDFRLVKVDLRNAVARHGDSIATDGRFRLLPWGTGPGEAPPCVFRTTGIVKTTPTATFSGAGLQRIAEVRVQVSSSPGQEFAFGITDPDGAPKGTVTLYDVSSLGTPTNPLAGSVSRLSISKTGDAATWTFRTVTGPGQFSVDLARGTYRLRLSAADIRPSFDAIGFRVSFTLRTPEDVAALRTGTACFFHRRLRLDANQPYYGSGRRVVSKGERVPGGTLFVDALRITRKLSSGPAPAGQSDGVTASGTLRTCPGATPPATPTLLADITVGDLTLPGIVMRRIGRQGSKYTASGGSGPTWRVDLDAVKGSFSFRASGASPLSQCVDADFTGGSTTNDSRLTVGGMTVPVTIRFARVYEATVAIPVVRRPGGKLFER